MIHEVAHLVKGIAIKSGRERVTPKHILAERRDHESYVMPLWLPGIALRDTQLASALRNHERESAYSLTDT